MSLKISKFFNNGDNLTFQIKSFYKPNEVSYLMILRNSELIQTIVEPTSLEYYSSDDTLYIADFNGDGLKDIKLITSLNGNGIGAFAKRVIYLFQDKDYKFIKISFLDMFEDNEDTIQISELRAERDFNNDRNFEIITKTLNKYENHNYWTFNLYNYINGNLKCVNDKFNYPIMIQYLDKGNYKVTNKISREKMKKYSIQLPLQYDKKE